MSLEALTYTSLGGIIAAATVANWRESRRIRRDVKEDVDRLDRQVNGTEARPGLIQRVKRLRKRLNKEVSDA